MAALEEIANDNPFEGVPTRATGTPGHEESVDYVVDIMEAAGFNVSLQQFEADIFFEQARRLRTGRARTRPSTRATTARTGSGTPPTSPATETSPRQAVVVDFTEPTTQASASSSGCEASDYDGLNVTGKVVLLQRGTCDFGLKAEIAGDAGAAAAVIFNEGTIGAADRNDVLIPTLAGYDVTIPVVGTDYATGRALVDLIAGGQTSRCTSRSTASSTRTSLTNNVIAETPAVAPTAPSSSAGTSTRSTRGRASTTTAPASA